MTFRGHVIVIQNKLLEQHIEKRVNLYKMKYRRRNVMSLYVATVYFKPFYEILRLQYY